MKISAEWINSWLNKSLTEKQLIEALEKGGIELEQYIASESLDSRIVVARVKTVAQHPNADRLHLVDLEVGSGEDVRVVCGAPNVRDGLMVAFAQVGTRLPDGTVLKEAKIRGEVSHGMLCSALELGLGDDHTGIVELPEASEIGSEVAKIFPSRPLIDVKTQANRPDLQSMYGLAREAAAMTGVQLKELPRLTEAVGNWSALARDSAAERLHLLRLSVNSGMPTPEWMKQRLETCGVRPISLVVDITNYVCLELGQPMHAYDADKVKLPLGARKASEGEVVVTLDGTRRILSDEDLVVFDQSGPIGLAGVMGGKSTEVGSATREILLEAAVFDGASVRRTAKRHGIRTEASARFERGLPVELPLAASGRAVELLKELAGAKVLAEVDQLNARPMPRSIDLSLRRLNTLLGLEVAASEAVSVLGRLGIEVRVNGPDDLVSVGGVPWWRPDLKESQDLVEEIVRVIGYERVPSRIPVWEPRNITFDSDQSKLRRLRSLLVGLGLFEVMTYSFVGEDQLEAVGLEPKDQLRIKNPLSSEQDYLRPELLPSHLNVAARNRHYAKEWGFFEISKVFTKRADGEQPLETTKLGITLLRQADGYRYLKGIIDAVMSSFGVGPNFVANNSNQAYAPERRAAVMTGGLVVGYLGQVTPRLVRSGKLVGELAHAELSVDDLIRNYREKQLVTVGKFPGTYRDLSVVLDDRIDWQDVRDYMAELNLAKVEFLNDYYGDDLPEGKKSLAFRLVVEYPDRTPTDADGEAVEERAMVELNKKFGAKKRD